MKSSLADGHATDAPLLARLHAGDNEAFREFLIRHMARVRAVARRILGREDGVDDVVQDTFISAFKALPGFRGDAALGTWLYRIAINAALMHLRSSKPTTTLPIDDLLPTFSDGGHTYDRPPRRWSASAEDLACNAETRALVRRAIDSLSDDHRLVLTLRDIEELSTRETAEILGVSEAVVKTRLHRARQALRTVIDRDCMEVHA